MAGDSNDKVRSRRFTSKKSANHFARSIKNAKVLDLRNEKNSKSNFKVKYTKGNAKNRNVGNNGDNP